jgi:hypothetical protein
MLHGRRSEYELVDGLLNGVRGGRSAILVVRGEPGIGKTVRYLVDQASGFRVARGVGVESEMEFPSLSCTSCTLRRSAGLVRSPIPSGAR